MKRQKLGGADWFGAEQSPAPTFVRAITPKEISPLESLKNANKGGLRRDTHCDLMISNMILSTLLM